MRRIEAEHVYHQRMLNATSAFTELSRLVNDQSVIDRLKLTFAGIPKRWQFQTDETIKEQYARRRRVTAKLRAAAKALQSDPELQHITILGIEDDPQHGYRMDWLWNSKASNRPTVSEVIEGLATDIESTSPYFGSMSRRCTLDKYVCLNVFSTLMSLGVYTARRRPMKETAAIAGALLNKSISTASIGHDQRFDALKARKKYAKE